MPYVCQGQEMQTVCWHHRLFVAFCIMAHEVDGAEACSFCPGPALLFVMSYNSPVIDTMRSLLYVE